MKIKEISRVETNEFYNPDKGFNGGGYSQPDIVFEYNGKTGTIEGRNAGMYGKRYWVKYDGKGFYRSTRNGADIAEGDFTVDDIEFIEAFNSKYKNYAIKQFSKSYKEYDKWYIGSSDIASLILVGHKNDEGLKLHDLHFGIDDSYSAYIVDDNAIIGDHYKLEAEFNTWLKIYDDDGLVNSFKYDGDELVKRFNADIIRVYRAGMQGCIIQLIDK